MEDFIPYTSGIVCEPPPPLRELGLHVVSMFERCATARFQWANDNAARFETPKPKAIMSSHRRRHHGASGMSGYGTRPPLRSGGNAMTGDLVGLRDHLSRESTPADWQDLPIRDYTPRHRQHIWCITASSAQPPAGHHPGSRALRSRDRLEWQVRGRGRVPEGHKSQG